jgi:hypothetical protein
MDNAVIANRPTFAAGGHAYSHRVPWPAPRGCAADKQPMLLLAGDIGTATISPSLSSDHAAQGVTTCEPSLLMSADRMAFDLLSPLENSNLYNVSIHQSPERR